MDAGSGPQHIGPHDRVASGFGGRGPDRANPDRANPDGVSVGRAKNDHADTGPVTPHGPRSLMIAYDGSPNADRAITYANRFLTTPVAHVVTAWQPGTLNSAGMSSLGAGMQPYVDADMESGIDDALRHEASDTNAKGVALAKQMGLEAVGTLVEVESTVWAALVAAADTLDVDLLVCGTRGETGFRALLHSSVAGHVLKHCHRPVFIVPASCERQAPVTL